MFTCKMAFLVFHTLLSLGLLSVLLHCKAQGIVLAKHFDIQQIEGSLGNCQRSQGFSQPVHAQQAGKVAAALSRVWALAASPGLNFQQKLRVCLSSLTVGTRWLHHSQHLIVGYKYQTDGWIKVLRVRYPYSCSHFTPSVRTYACICSYAG